MGRKTKLAPSHSTLIDQADLIRRFATNLDTVTKISAGIIVPAGVAVVSIKFKQESGALFLKVRGTHAVQDLRIYSKNHTQTEAAIKVFCTKQGWLIR